jgi:tetrapyrrole methylase family protein / MazG family protein
VPTGRIVVVGLGPAGPDLLTVAAVTAIGRVPVRFVRTWRHPSAPAVGAATSFDEVYDTADTFDEVYLTITERLVAAAAEHGEVLYAVPGSPYVLERTVEHLRAEANAGRCELQVVAGMSFLDLAYARLGIDPFEAGVRMVDGHVFAEAAAGERGPLLVAHTHARYVLSDIKLAVDDEPTAPVVVLQRLGLPEERVFEVTWSELDRSFDPDHLTCIYVPELGAPVGAELVRFHELVRTLREQCPWDREQDHRTLTRHLLEETYEVLEAIEAYDPESGEGSEHLCEELGDLLFQIEFHAVIAEQDGRFTMADVARGVHDKLVRRHPHVFGDVEAEDPAAVAANWEDIKKAEKGHASVMDGIAGNLPSPLYALKIQKKAASTGFEWPSVDDHWDDLAEEIAELHEAIATGDVAHIDAEAGDVLFAAIGLCRRLKVDPETALRSAASRFRDRFTVVESLAVEQGAALRDLPLETLQDMWREAKRLLA